MTNHQLIPEDERDDYEYEDFSGGQRWTLALDSDGDLRFNDKVQGLITVSGTEAAKQSFKVALLTPKGEDDMDPEFGLDVFRATNSWLELERQIRKTLNYDDYRHDRVKSIDEVEIERRRRSRHAYVWVELTLETGDIEHIEFDIQSQ